MRKLFWSLLTPAFTILLIIQGPAFGAEQRVALVIGNGDYRLAPLRNPVNDAEDIADILSKCGFRVEKAINADRREMRDVIRRFGELIKNGGVGLFFYAGHGLQVDGENYLVPIRANVTHENEVEDECLKVSSVLRKMESAHNRLNIIILDACRNNPFGRGYRSSMRGLARMDAPTGSILAYATAPGATASDGPGKNGLYTSRLLTHILTPGLEIGKLFRLVRMDVMKDSENRQVPWESSSLIGEFYFSEESEENDILLSKSSSQPTIPATIDIKRNILPPGAKVTALSFFESGRKPPPKDQRTYDNRFKQSAARFINWELCLEFPEPPGRRIDYTVEEVYYSENDSIVHKDVVSDFVNPEWTVLCQTHSSGWESAGKWKTGKYKVVLSINGRETASGFFEIY